MYKNYQPLKKSEGIIKRNNSSLLSRYFREECLTGWPVIKRGKGPYVYDYDGNKYVDFFLASGSLVLGHSHPHLTSVLKSWVSRGYGSGYLTASQELLARRVHALIVRPASPATPARPEEFERSLYIFAVTPAEAALGALALAARMGYTKAVRAVPGEGADRTFIASSLFEGVLNPLPVGVLDQADADLVAVDPGLDGTAGECIVKILDAKKKRGFLLISDESGFRSHALGRTVPSFTQAADVRIIGPWAAGGIPVSCAIVDKGVLESPRVERRMPSFEETVERAGSLPLYLVKSALRGLDLIERSGGLEAILEKQRIFAAMLDERYFTTKGDFSFLKGGPHIYRELRTALLKKGFFLPPASSKPLALSLSHSGELLEKCARGLDLVLSAFDR